MSALWFEADWPAPPGVRALSTLRGAAGDGGISRLAYAHFNLGDHVGDDPRAVAENRQRLQREARLPAEPSWLAQVHGVNVADLDAAGPRGPADAAIARSSGKVCAILTADCLPLVLTTERGDRVAAAHAGWRGLAAGVIEATVRALQAPEEICWPGWGLPSARGTSRWAPRSRDAFVKTDPAAVAAFEPNARGRFMADLPQLARRRLENLGVSRIYGGGECTFAAADRYYSHRREGITGRQATLIWREG